MTEFPTPFKYGGYGDGAPSLTLLEQSLMQLGSCIRLKPEWQKKIYDQNIVAKWRVETKQVCPNDDQFQYVIDELKYMSSLSQNGIRVSPVENVWEADNLIDNKTKGELLNNVSCLENVPKEQKDWHPGSNYQVLDLVHPSLYCYVHKITRIIDKPAKFGSFELTPPVENCFWKNVKNSKNTNVGYSISEKYQWLPSEFQIGLDGKVSIKSYINNLDYDNHKFFYETIENIFAKFVPMFNLVLNDMTMIEHKKRRVDVDEDWYESEQDYVKRIKEEDPRRFEEMLEDYRKELDQTIDDNDLEKNFLETDEFLEEYEKYKLIDEPIVNKFIPPQLSSNLINLNGKKVQVIVKLANIELTPGNPNYKGGVWHVEGMENERIVATGIYYYHSENIAESHLQFRQAIKEPDYQQNDNRGVREIYGLNDNDELNIPLGHVVTQSDRCIAFPNIYQHRVDPFTLLDPSKPGYRKILVFFLVDPFNPILSTANVAPQQRNMTLSDAKKHREELMKERKFFVETNTKEYFERPFSLCEH